MSTSVLEFKRAHIKAGNYSSGNIKLSTTSTNQLFDIMYYRRLQYNSSVREKVIVCFLFRADY